MRLARHVAFIREMENAYTILVGTFQGKRPHLGNLKQIFNKHAELLGFI
jgi:hypothetical protein